MSPYRVVILDDGGETIGIHFAEFGDDRDACSHAHDLLADGGCARVEVWWGELRIYFTDVEVPSKS